MAVRLVEPVPAWKRVRYAAIEAARQLYHAPGRAAFRQRLRNLRKADGGEPKVSFGWLHDPARPSETGIGGAVKLAHLRRRFGEARESFNILYLVSSVLHLVPHVEELVSWAKRNGVKVVWNQNGVAYPAWCGDYYPWFNAPMSRLIRQADFVVYQSEFCRACADRYLGPVNAPWEVLWNPVDVRHFTPGAVLDAGRWELLAMGTNHSFYRVKASLDCLAALVADGVSARLTIAGEMRWPGGDDEVARTIDALGVRDRVRLLPPFTQEEAAGLYRNAHVLLHPKYKDPCPTVPIEAMACGIPVVGSRSGGMPELVPPDCGELADVPDDWCADHAPDARALADGVRRVMEDRERRSAAARARAEAVFDQERWVQRHEDIFLALLSRR